ASRSEGRIFRHFPSPCARDERREQKSTGPRVFNQASRCFIYTGVKVSRMKEKETKKYRVVCENEGERISLRTKARDQYEACEQIGIFLRKKEFDYRIVLIELCQ
ncbi:MAG: hypothetical protein ACRD68_19170, partial [Pyrinomonadaceae bacterium]